MTRTLRKNSELPTSKHDPLLYVLSDSSVDRYGDIVEASGWQLDEFKRNPVCLASHDPNFVVGRWDGLHIAGGQLRGHLELAPQGVSTRIDEVRQLVLCGYLPACSVGFIPVAQEPRKTGKGVRYTKQILAECSVVSIPANSNALLQRVRALGISNNTLQKLFVDAPVNGSLAQRQERARASLARAEETKRFLKKYDEDVMQDEYYGLTSDQIVQRELARMHRDEIRKEIDFRIDMNVGVKIARMNNVGEMATEAAEQFIRDRISRAFNDDDRSQAIRDAENARRFREYK